MYLREVVEEVLRREGVVCEVRGYRIGELDLMVEVSCPSREMTLRALRVVTENVSEILDSLSIAGVCSLTVKVTGGGITARLMSNPPTPELQVEDGGVVLRVRGEGEIRRIASKLTHT